MRGEVWTVCASGYASKPRPAIVVQSDAVNGFESTVVCLLTTDGSMLGPTRIPIAATKENGLSRDCFAMAEKPLAVKTSSLGQRLGMLEDESLTELDGALKFALGLS